MSRATVYRYFPGGRDELISAVVGWEFARFFLRLYEEVSDAETSRRSWSGATCSPTAPSSSTRSSSASSSPARILLPRMTTEADQTQGLVASFLAPYLVRHGMAEGSDLDMAADFLARMVLSYIAFPRAMGPQRPRAGGAARPVRAARRHPVSGTAPEPAPPPSPCYRHPEKAASVLSAPATARSAPTAWCRRVGLAVPRLHAEGAKRSRQVPGLSPTRAAAARAWSAPPTRRRSCSPLIGVNVVVFFLERFGNDARHQQYASSRC